MTFGEKVRSARKSLHLNQTELAKMLGISRQALTNYETDKARPRGLAKYHKLAEILQVDVDYLLSQEEEFVLEAKEKYGTRASKQADELINKIGALFAGGELSPNDKDAVMRAMQTIYWDAKDENKKYTPKKYLSNTED